MSETISRRGLFAGLLGLGIISGCEYIDRWKIKEPEDNGFFGVSRDVIFVRRLLPDGKKLDFYTMPGGEKLADTDGLSFIYDNFSVNYPEIYETLDGRRWGKLRGYASRGDEKLDAYIPYEQSEHIRLSRQQVMLLEKISGEYRHPFSPRETVNKEDIGNISSGNHGVFEKHPWE